MTEATEPASNAGANADAAPGMAGPPTLDLSGAIATITLRRPALANRLELADLEVLGTQFAMVQTNPDLRVLKLVSTGKHFCSGFNVGQVGAAGATAAARFEALADAIERSRLMTVAVIQGGVYGGACDLALACDFRIGTPACEMFVPAARLGLHFYRGGLERFVTRLGLHAAKRVLLAAERFDAIGMREIGMLDQIVDPASALAAAGEALAQTLAGMAPLAALGMKKHLNRIARGTLDAADLARDIASADHSQDLQEGGLAWIEKRAPVFKGY